MAEIALPLLALGAVYITSNHNTLNLNMEMILQIILNFLPKLIKIK